MCIRDRFNTLLAGMILGVVLLFVLGSLDSLSELSMGRILGYELLWTAVSVSYTHLSIGTGRAADPLSTVADRGPVLFTVCGNLHRGASFLEREPVV